MEKKTIAPENFFKTACIFEGSLIFLAILLGWFADINPFENIHFSENAVMYGILGALPLFLLFLVLQQLPYVSVQKIRNVLFETLGPSMHRYNWADLLVIAVIAGVSEEILFRGVIQPWIEDSWGMMTGLIACSLLFGLVHAVTLLYAILAASVGIYLGLVLDYESERNLLIPIVIHSVYDFLAFIVIVKMYRKTLVDKSGEQ